MKEKDIDKVDKKDEQENQDVLSEEISLEVDREGEVSGREKSKIIYLHDRKNKTGTSGTTEDLEEEKTRDAEKPEEEIAAETEEEEKTSDEAGEKEEAKGEGEMRQRSKKSKVVKLNSNSWKDTLLHKLGETGAAFPSDRKELMMFGAALLILVMILFLSRGIWKSTHNGGEIEKYTVGKFVMEVNQASQQEETPFPRGKRIQLYGPIIRMNEATVYMKSEDKL
ncbi:MAG: hypothetical protein Q3993_04050, partial [Filifactor alocis]|nr:hypothetical protein [Filifactor alocis]